MRNLTIVLALMGFLASPFVTIQAQEVNADDILGVWLNEDKDAHVDIYKEGDKFYGKIVWLKEPKNEKGEKKTQIAHTLNGSALALPRILAALLENNQTTEGIKIPEVLQPYTGFDMIK